MSHKNCILCVDDLPVGKLFDQKHHVVECEMARAAWKFICGRRLWRCVPRLRTTALESLNTFEECLCFMSTVGNAAAEEF